MRRIVVEKRKWSGVVTSRWSALAMQRGERIVWLTPESTTIERQRGKPKRTSEVQRSATVGDWWVATLHGEGNARRWKIDAATPPSLDGDVLSFVDLDLDVVMGPGHRLAVRDVGQFATRAWRNRYPPGVIARAILGVLGALGRAGTRRWPFDGSFDRRA